MRPEGSVVLVTGANRGIGHAFVRAYLTHGAAKVYAAGRRPDDLASTVALNPEQVVPLVLDVTNPDTIRAAAEAAGDVTVLVNNAGVLTPGGLLDTSLEELRRDMEVNYFGLIEVTRAFAPVIERNGGGAIINLLSVVSLASMPGIAGYNASKAAAWSATQSLRADLAPKKIHVFGVYPGPIETDMAKDIPMEKTSPEVVAETVIQGVAAGHEDIFPDPMSAQMYVAWKQDHKMVEKQFAGN